MRVLLCAVPALIAVLLGILLGLGPYSFIFGAGVLGLGIDVTQRRPERGEW